MNRDETDNIQRPPALAGGLTISLMTIGFLAASMFSLLQETSAEQVFAIVAAAATIVSLILYTRQRSTLTRLRSLRTDDERRQQELEQALIHFRQSEERFRSLSASVPIGIFEIDESGCCTYTNSAWQTIAGMSFEESLVNRWDHAVRESVRQSLFTDWRAAADEGSSFERMVPLQVSQNGERWGKLSISPVLSDAGTTFVGVLEDITDLRNAEIAMQKDASDLMIAKEMQERDAIRLTQTVEALYEARGRAEASTRSKSEFLANMSHEIRTPMTAILGYTDLLLEQYKAGGDQQESLRIIKRNGEFLLQIINDILDVSKIEAGRIQIERLRCRPTDVVSDVRALMQVRADEKKFPLQVQYDGPIPETVETDPTRLRQILINLVGNAIKFTEEGFVRIVVRHVSGTSNSRGSTAGGHDGFLEFDVIDSGIGMDEAAISNLFQPFTQADTSTTRRFGGSGLGLTISKRLAGMLGGDITVESREGTGSTFRATVTTGSLEGVPMIEHAEAGMPRPDDDRVGDDRVGDDRVAGETAAQTKPASSETAAQPDDPLAADRILLAEDGPDNQRLIKFILTKAGADVTVVENGQLAVDKALAARADGEPFDLILMDMQMPVLDGYNATQLLREKRYTGPIVALTAHAMQSDRVKCLAAGCDEFVTKPIDRSKLIATIREQLGHSGHQPLHSNENVCASEKSVGNLGAPPRA